MSSSDFRESGRTTLIRPLVPLETLVLGALLLICLNTIAAEPPVFAPLPNQPSINLTNGIILVSPTKLNFGAVAIGKRATNTFLVENFGHGKLVGTASVPAAAPFKIISGEKYALREKEVQIVTLVYTPQKQRVDKATVTFTGGNGAKALVMGKAAGE